jgi:hypothetical protein
MCSFCGSPLPAGRIGFRDLCASCGRELHICLHCGFYKPGAYRDCAETVPEAVRDKERMNFCEYFKPGTIVAGGTGAAKAKDAKHRFDDLFST